ncbi:MAG: SDR family NAD(P)-dependent oxidoreductase [Acidimicrobiales bacterium]
MISADRRCVLQGSSGASLWPGPYSAVYVATKIFVTSFGRSLSEELVGTGVSCTTVLPGRERSRLETAARPQQRTSIAFRSPQHATAVRC